MIFSDITEARLNCRQDCITNGKCHICYRILDLANPEKIKEYAKEKGIE